MGIRYDSGIRRATNGPIIFFSDPSSQESFAEEIRGAIISNLSFYSYKKPGDLMISFGSSEGYLSGITEPGFVIAPFDPSKPYITIPYKGCRKDSVTLDHYKFPEVSTSYSDYKEEVEKVIEDLQAIRGGKVVASRVVIRDGYLDLAAQFYDFCNRFPDAFVFCFSTPSTGCWIGASPELLLESRDGYINSMALAGTRKAGVSEEWDEKNKEEQEIVVRYITEVFNGNGLNPIIGENYNKKTGTLEHICTPITFKIEETVPDLEPLLKNLSPTPALCGSPKEFAFREIKKYEQFDRGCYGGFCGPYHSINDFSFNVVLRCAAVRENKYCIYAGGGITSMSNVETEWHETESKILNTFGK